MRIYLVVGAVIVLLCFFLMLNSTLQQEPYTLKNFIKDNEIQNPIEIAMEDKTYIFSDNKIYIFRDDSSYEYTADNNLGKYTVGGREKGSVGVIFNDDFSLQRVEYYSVLINGQKRVYEASLKKGRYLVVTDTEIWNPVPNFEVIFLDKDRREIDRISL